ncbi:MAG TPA: hypothetical protein VIG57_01690, partial [Candidatus Entotheonella sp.]
SVPYAQLALARRSELCRVPLRPLLGTWEPPPRGGREPREGGLGMTLRVVTGGLRDTCGGYRS